VFVQPSFKPAAQLIVHILPVKSTVPTITVPASYQPALLVVIELVEVLALLGNVLEIVLTEVSSVSTELVKEVTSAATLFNDA
jgi:hypothetical protein